MTICGSGLCSGRSWIRCWRYERAGANGPTDGDSACDELTQPFFVLRGDKIIILGDDGPPGVDIQRDQSFLFEGIGAIAEGPDQFE